MKKLALLVLSGMMALVLTACGEQTPKEPEVTADTTTTEQVQPAAAQPEAAAPAAEAAAPAEEDKAATEDTAAPAQE